MFFYCMAVESWTLSLFMAGPKSKLEATRFVHKRCTHLRPKLPRKIVEPRVFSVLNMARFQLEERLPAPKQQNDNDWSTTQYQ